MRPYSRSEEENVRAERLAKEWRRSGLLDPVPSPMIERDLFTGLRRTNFALRATLFVFGCIVVAAAAGLAVNLLEINDQSTVAAALIIAAAVCFGCAEALAAKFRLYRFGVEEAFVISAIALLGTGSGILISRLTSVLPAELPTFAGLIAAAIGALLAYLRFGYVYAALGSLACATLACFQIGQPAEIERGLAALALAAACAGARKMRRPHGDDYPGDDYGDIAAAAWLGTYCVLNLQLTGESEVAAVFYWGTYVMALALPAVGLFVAVRDKDRRMIQANAVMALATLVTNKMYLGWERHTWDPIVLGLALIGSAIAIRRWLALGPENQRRGYTALRLLDSDIRVVAALSMAAGAIQPLGGGPAPASAAAPGFEPGGGRSGGGGAGGSF